MNLHLRQPRTLKPCCDRMLCRNFGALQPTILHPAWHVTLHLASSDTRYRRAENHLRFNMTSAIDLNFFRSTFLSCDMVQINLPIRRMC